MANPIILAQYKFPLTEKPTMLPEPVSTYTDIFNLQNTCRLIISIMVEEAPVDGKQYVRQNGAWVELP